MTMVDGMPATLQVLSPGSTSGILTTNLMPQNDHVPLQMGIKDALNLIPEYSSKSLTEFVYFSEGCLEALDLLGFEHEKLLLKFIKLKLKGMAYSQYALIVAKFENLPGFLDYVQKRDCKELKDKRVWEDQIKKVRQEIDESVRTYGARMETTLQCALTALKLRDANDKSCQNIELLANQCFGKNMIFNLGNSNSVLDKGRHIINKVLWVEQWLQVNVNREKCKTCCSVHYTDDECKANKNETNTNGLQVDEENVKEVRDKSIFSLEKSLKQEKKSNGTVVPLRSFTNRISKKKNSNTHPVQSEGQLPHLRQRREEITQRHSQMENTYSIEENQEQELKEQLNYSQYELKSAQSETDKVTSLNEIDLLKPSTSQAEFLTSQVHDHRNEVDGNQNNNSCENQSELAKKCMEAREKHMDSYLDDDEQKLLEMKHREEEGELFRQFDLKMKELEAMKYRKEIEIEKNKLYEDLRIAKAELVEKQISEMQKLMSKRGNVEKNESLYQDGSLVSYPATPPPPEPPTLPKTELYKDPLELAYIDQTASNVAKEDQYSFTDLVRQLVKNCVSDYEKARAIYRWISTLDLNEMQFIPNIKEGTVMALLRDTKVYAETYEALFQRLCSYAGLHCKIIEGYHKGYSGPDGAYMPGMHFEGDAWKGGWNAVYVAGSWRFVNCDWGARLIDVENGSDTYKYDDHYFLTDPQEFIYNFFPLQKEWQLLKQPISLKEFEELPCVWSEFFKCGLRFKDTNAVMHTVASGRTTVRMVMPEELKSSLIFRYNLVFYDDYSINTYDKVSLKRFVMQTVVDNEVSFRVHVPCSGSFLLIVYVKKQQQSGETTPRRAICRTKIVCKELQTVTLPLPNCRSEEWGPTKAIRIFGLVPISHQEARVRVSNELKIQFRMTRPIAQFRAALRKNDVEKPQLSDYVSHTVTDDIVTFTISVPKNGQYGLDIYAREPSPTPESPDSRFKHCCQYLIIK